MQALIANNVIGDFRAPDLIRFGLTPLYLRYVDVFDAVAILADILRHRRWDQAARAAPAKLRTPSPCLHSRGRGEALRRAPPPPVR